MTFKLPLCGASPCHEAGIPAAYQGARRVYGDEAPEEPSAYGVCYRCAEHADVYGTVSGWGVEGAGARIDTDPAIPFEVEVSQWPPSEKELDAAWFRFSAASPVRYLVVADPEAWAAHYPGLARPHPSGHGYAMLGAAVTQVDPRGEWVPEPDAALLVGDPWNGGRGPGRPYTLVRRSQ